MTRELKVMYMWPFKWPQLKDLFTDAAGNKLCIGKKVYLKHLPRWIRMWNVVFKEKEEPENLEKKKLLEGRRDLTTVTSRVGLGPRPHCSDGVRDCPHPLPSLPPPPPPPNALFLNNNLYCSRQWIFNLEGWGEERLLEGGDYFKHFRQRRAVIQGRRLIEGRLLFEEIR